MKKKTDKKMTMSKHARCKICVDESRIWNMDTINTKRLFYLTGFLYKEKHLLDCFKIADSKNLGPAEKGRYIRYYTLKTHKSNADREKDVIYSTFSLKNTVLFHGLEDMLV